MNAATPITTTGNQSNKSAQKMKLAVESPAEMCYDEVAVNEADSLKGDNPMRKSETKICALYERLSREDDDVQGQSNSITTQKQLLADYAKSQGFTNIRHYTDDGTSGVRFEREAWQELIADVEAGKIAQVLCKDMSRLGRDHVQVGLILEQLRIAQVRFIAVTNNIDSAYPETLEFAPFLNLVNEWYARDISRKIMTAKRSNGRNGKYISSIAPYGYRKSESDKGVWEIDPEAAEIVRRIFKMTIEGYGITSIANRLRKDKIYSPGYYMAQRGTGTCKNKDFDDPYRWQGNMVDMIISRMEYKGCMVNLKTQKQSFKDKRSKQMPREEWLVFEDKHEPIVDADTWQAANDIRQKKRRNKHDSLGEPHPLTGLLYCADCKSKMHHNRGRIKSNGEDTGRVKNYYTCKQSKHGIEFCTGHRINGGVIEELVLETLQRVSAYATTNEKEFTRQINEMYSTQQADNVKAGRRKLKSNQNRHAELDKLIQRIYEDMVAEKISEYAFKLIFGSGDTLFLISLLNAIFANKKFPRIIKSLTIVNPYLEKHSKEDKLSILDIRAQLDDGTTILIEMHLYDIDDLKYKTIRSWARTYGEEIKSGESYSAQPPVICITFANGSLDDGENQKIHKCCKIMDIDDNTIFSDALELHYINMKAFVKVINETGGIGKGETQDSMLAKWLAVITEKEIKDKTIIKNICEEQEEISMAVSALVRLSEDKVTRQEYLRRQDDILLSNKKANDYKRMERRLEESEAEIERLRKENEELRAGKATQIIPNFIVFPRPIKHKPFIGHFYALFADFSDGTIKKSVLTQIN